MKVLVIGANGNTATRLIRRLAQGAHDPIAMIRHPGQRPKFDDLGVPTVLADLEYPIDHAVAGCDAVIFAAGSGGKTGKDKTVLVDQLGAIRSMVAAQVSGARRYIMLSSIGNDIHSTSPIAHYHKAKAHADNHLAGNRPRLHHRLPRWAHRRRRLGQGSHLPRPPRPRSHLPRKPGRNPRPLPGPPKHHRQALQPARRRRCH